MPSRAEPSATSRPFGLRSLAQEQAKASPNSDHCSEPAPLTLLGEGRLRTAIAPLSVQERTILAALPRRMRLRRSRGSRFGVGPRTDYSRDANAPRAASPLARLKVWKLARALTRRHCSRIPSTGWKFARQLSTALHTPCAHLQISLILSELAETRKPADGAPIHPRAKETGQTKSFSVPCRAERWALFAPLSLPRPPQTGRFTVHATRRTTDARYTLRARPVNTARS